MAANTMTGVGVVRHSIMLLALALSFPVCAAVSLNQLTDYEPRLFADPKGAYQELTEVDSTSEASIHRQIWVLLRRAQAENTLGLYSEMVATLAQIATLRDRMGKKQQATYLYLLGVQQHKGGQLKESVVSLKQAVAAAKSNPDWPVYALAAGELGYVHALSGSFYQANLILHRTYNELVGRDDAFYNGLMEEALGDTYNYSGNYQEALTYYQRALGDFVELDYPPFIASTLLGLATVNRKLGNWETALTLFEDYEQALRFSEEYSEPFYLHYGRAMTLAEMGQCAAAVPAIGAALAMRGLVDYDAELLKKRALCHLELGEVASAKLDLSRARTILDAMEELHGTQWHLELDYVAGRIAWQEQHFDTALRLLDEYFTQTSELMQRNNSERLRSLQSNLEAERKNQEIASLLQRAQLKEVALREQALRVEQQQFYLFAVFIVIAFLLAFVFFQFRHARKLLSLSIRDELTGLHNRRYVFDYFRDQSNKGSDDHPAFSLIAFDIDNFKHINDNFGHLAGDNVIKGVASIAHDALRANDIISRIGGDEFLIVLPRTSQEESQEIASRILVNIAKHPFVVCDGSRITVTVSMGIARPDEQTATPVDIEKLIDAADRALYESKRSGKNRLTEAPMSAGFASNTRGFHSA